MIHYFILQKYKPESVQNQELRNVYQEYPRKKSVQGWIKDLGPTGWAKHCLKKMEDKGLELMATKSSHHAQQIVGEQNPEFRSLLDDEN